MQNLLKIPARLFPMLGIILAVSMGTAPEACRAAQEEGGRWIAPEGGENAGQDVWSCFRKTFELPRPPARAVARIAADSKYWLWVNGTNVVFEGGLKWGPDRTGGYYDEIDLAPWLRAGTNTVAILAWHWGRDGFSHKNSGRAGLLFAMDAGGVPVGSGTGWKARVHPGYAKAEGEAPNFRLPESNVRYDARQDIGQWMQPEYDDREWALAKEPGGTGGAPWKQLTKRPVPLWKNFGLKDYVNAGEFPAVSNGKDIVARLPYNAQVTPYLKIDAEAGQRVGMRTDTYWVGSERSVRAEYVTRAGVQEFEMPGWMNGHEVIYRIPEGVKVLSLQYRETGYDTEFAGVFRSDDAFANTLWEKARRTLYVNMRDTYMDCPDRERAQWWGDAVLEIGEAFYALSPSSDALGRKAILELCAWQKEDHSLFSPIPGSWDKELSQQMLASVGYYGFWTYYLYSGDAETVRKAYPHVRDYLKLWSIGKDGLVEHRRGGWDWADWGTNADARVLDQAWYCLALQGAANLARLAGDEAGARGWEEQRRSIIKAANRFCWNGSAYRSPGYAGATDDRANGLCVVAGIAEPEKYPAIRKILETEYHASPYMEKYVLEALLLMNEPDAALARMKKRYGPIVANSWTTLPELWVADRQAASAQKSSVNHAWSGGPLILLSQYYAGLAPLEPGWKTFQIRPQMGPLREIDAAVETGRGRISAHLKRDGGNYTVDVAVPAGTRGVLSLPLEAGRTGKVEINGRPVWKDGSVLATEKGAAFDGAGEGRLRFRLPAGTWKVVLSETPAPVSL